MPDTTTPRTKSFTCDEIAEILAARFGGNADEYEVRPYSEEKGSFLLDGVPLLIDNASLADLIADAGKGMWDGDCDHLAWIDYPIAAEPIFKMTLA